MEAALIMESFGVDVYMPDIPELEPEAFEGNLFDDEDTDRTNKPLRIKPGKIVKVKYSNAEKMARSIDLNTAYYTVINGNFIYGDFIEALINTHTLKCEEIYITTLGMSQNNIDSMVTISEVFKAKQLNLIVSNYFFGVEKQNLMPYLRTEIRGLPFKVAVCNSHAKITLIKTKQHNLVMFGSANLSSSQNIEQFMILNDAELYGYNRAIFEKIMDRHTVIDGLTDTVNYGKAKKSWSKDLWEALSNGSDEQQ
jgi:hypothetical protein